MKVIIYTDPETDSLAIVRPFLDSGLTIEQIAAKDVPAGVPYLIVDASEIPTDRSQRQAWFADTTSNPDGTGADYGVGSSKDVIGYNPDGTPVLRG